MLQQGIINMITKPLLLTPISISSFILFFCFLAASFQSALAEDSPSLNSAEFDSDSQVRAVDGVLVKSQNELAPCAEMVSGCLKRAEVDRASCYFSGSQHPFCLGTSVGELMHSRWIVSARPGIGDASLGLLGTHIVNSECISSFDQDFISLLDSVTNGDRSTHAQAIEELAMKLRSCNREVTRELSMP